MLKDITNSKSIPAGESSEVVFNFKLLTEKAMASKDFQIVLLLLDMSKAFNTAKRIDLFEILKEALDKDELDITKLLVGGITLQVKVGMKRK